MLQKMRKVRFKKRERKMERVGGSVVGGGGFLFLIEPHRY
jgi:hypothetical protein